MPPKQNDNVAVSIARIDERTKFMAENMEKMVTQAEFKPVKALVYGLVGLIMTAVVLAIIAVVVTVQPI